MATPLLRATLRNQLGDYNKTCGIFEVFKMSSKRLIMTSQTKLDKVMENLQQNPYYEKYADRIAKLQETSPEEFLQRIEKQEQKIKGHKVSTRFNKNPMKLGCLSKNSWSNTHITVRCYSQCASSNKYVSTPIFYVNAGPHIGHLYTAILADAIARYNVMLGHSVILSTGTDEHGNKVANAAKAAKLSIPDYCTKISNQFKAMCDTFDVNYSKFIRTTEEDHRKAVHHFWNLLQAKDHIYLGKYSGWYCLSDEAFLSDVDLTEVVDKSGKTIKVSVISGNPVEWTEEDNYKFRLSSFQNDLKHWLKNENTVRPAKFHQVLCDWVEEGACLQDLSISRPSHRVPWGIPTPVDESHRVYVWLDALVNYLTSLGFPNGNFREFWPPDVQIIGKDILKFHGIYWPAFLIAAGLEPPKTLLCHSHWTVDDYKMSKSKGNVICPFEAANSFTKDGLRYFLLREAVPYSDANYNAVKIERILNNDLANTFGNLVSRCTGKLINPWGEFPDPAKHVDSLTSETAMKLKENLISLRNEAQNHYKEFNLHHVVDCVMATLRNANQMVEFHKPWVLAKNHDTDSEIQLKAVISLALESSRIAALILMPIIPRLTTNLLDYLKIPKEQRTWDDTEPQFLHDQSKSRNIGTNSQILFKKIRAQ